MAFTPLSIHKLAQACLVNGQGDSLNIFARSLFDRAVSHGVACFFVDYARNVPRADGRSKTLADEKAQGIRPFWVHIANKDLIDVRTSFVGGREVVTHVRWWERPIVADGFGETCIPQIRVVEIKDDGKVWWTIFQEQADKNFAQTAC